MLPARDTALWFDTAVLYIFIASAVICLGCSSLFHLMSCHSEPVCRRLNRCDYIGIVLLIVGSFYPAVYYGFYCHTRLRIFYLTVITAFGASTFVMCVSHKFQTPEYRWIRTGMFAALGLSGIFPITHGTYIYGLSLSPEATSVNYLVAMGLLYGFGALLYGSRIPESLYPGKFDIWFHSHQLFHVFVVVAAVVHFVGMIKIFDYWHTQNHACALDVKQMINDNIKA